jgi:tetratricopeptide (TPR) repeat protein
VGYFAEALRRAKIDGRGIGSGEPRAAASTPAPPPDWVPIPDPQDEEERAPIPQDEEERACDASRAPWRREAIAEEPSEEEAKPLEILVADLTRRMGELAEALRRAGIDANGTGTGTGNGSGGLAAAASAPARPPDEVPLPVVEDEEEPVAEDEEERACDASLVSWQQLVIAEEPSEEEAEPLEIPAVDLVRMVRIQSQVRRRRSALLALALVIGVGALWWGFDRLSRLDLPDPNAPRVQGSESGAPAEFPAEARAIAGEERGAALRADVAQGPARASSPAQHGAEPIASPEATDVDSEDVAYLVKAGRNARAIGRLKAATEHFERAVALQEKMLGPDDPSIAGTLRQLGEVYADQRLDAEAEAAYLRALAINEGAYGSRSVRAAAALSDLALLYRRQGRSSEALPLLESALDIEQDAWGPQHPNVAARLAALGQLYHQQGLYEYAEPYLEEALAVREQVSRPDDPQTTGAMTSLAHLYRQQERYAEAEDLFRRVLAIHESTNDQLSVAFDLANLSVLYLSNSQFAEAEPVFERALMIDSTNPQVLVGLNQLARTAQAEGRSEAAEDIYEWALEVSEEALGSENTNTSFLRAQYAQYLRSLGRHDEADRLEES